jgi:predicted HTH transcriptional regulator
LIERKPDGFKDREARRVIVAFAKSTPEGQEAGLFIGIDDKTGRVQGVASGYSKVLEECYPSITVHMFEGKTVVAIVVPASLRKPHCGGGAYVREGSRSVLATDRLYEELMLSRQDLVRELLKYKRAHTLLTVRGIHYMLGSQKPFATRLVC